MKRFLAYFARVWRQPAELKKRQDQQAAELARLRLELTRRHLGGK